MNKFLTLAATSLAALQMQVVAQETRPNIIYIMSDDHALQAISAYGSRLAKVLPTPNLDRIANEGIRMDNCCVTNSISAPSRACIMTGQYSHKMVYIHWMTVCYQRMTILLKRCKKVDIRQLLSGSGI